MELKRRVMCLFVAQRFSTRLQQLQVAVIHIQAVAPFAGDFADDLQLRQEVKRRSDRNLIGTSNAVRLAGRWQRFRQS